MVEILDKKILEPVLSWTELVEWIKEEHNKTLPQISDQLISKGDCKLLNRLAWIDGLGSAVKSCTIFPKNQEKGIATVNGMMTLFADDTGMPEAILDFHQVTKWKTVADSLLAASILAPKNPKRYLIIGSGMVAKSLIEAFSNYFPNLEILIWNRTKENALKLVREYQNSFNIQFAQELSKAISLADIVSCATLSKEPIIQGEWITPKTHVDLIGAFTPEMREADDRTIQIGSLFVDFRSTTIDHIGEIQIPISNGTINKEDVIADFYDFKTGKFLRSREEEITVFKNGGGAHLDLMTAKYFLYKWRSLQST